MQKYWFKYNVVQHLNFFLEILMNLTVKKQRLIIS